MPFNGNGTFQRLRNWVADAAAGVKIRADYHDNEDDGFAQGLTNCITKDGQTIVTQNIPFNSKRITGLADPVNPQDVATKAYADTKIANTGNGTITGDLTVTGDGTITGNSTITGNLDVGGTAGATGYKTRTGLPGPYGPNFFNFNWVSATGNLEMWVDNTNMGAIASKTYADTTASNAASSKFPITGGTITGSLTVNGELIALQNFLRFGSSGSAGFIQWNGGANYALGGAGTIWHSGNFNPASTAGSLTVTGNLYIGVTSGGNVWQTDGTFAITGQGYKPSGGSWSSVSDARIKTVHGDYTQGLAAIKQLQPVRYEYKGNMPAHKDVLGREFVGLVAQQIETSMPEMVTQIAERIDDHEVKDLRVLDNSALVYALVNAVKELSARVEALEATP
jgi:Chaperone of endosialidase